MSVFRLEWEGSLAHLVVDDPDRKLNVLDQAAIAGLEDALAAVEAKSGLAGVILRSGKPGSFIAGADVDAIGTLTDRDEVRGLIRRAHAVFSRLASLPAPTVAAIDGVCLGGGTELALACDSRIASDRAAHADRAARGAAGTVPGLRRLGAAAEAGRSFGRAGPDSHRALARREARRADGSRLASGSRGLAHGGGEDASRADRPASRGQAARRLPREDLRRMGDRRESVRPCAGVPAGARRRDEAHGRPLPRAARGDLDHRAQLRAARHHGPRERGGRRECADRGPRVQEPGAHLPPERGRQAQAAHRRRGRRARRGQAHGARGCRRDGWRDRRAREPHGHRGAPARRAPRVAADGAADRPQSDRRARPATAYARAREGRADGAHPAHARAVGGVARRPGDRSRGRGPRHQASRVRRTRGAHAHQRGARHEHVVALGQ